jgi:hypothetical protein
MMVPETKTKVAVGLAITFVALNVFDILLTWQGLQLGATELNFFMNKVLALGFIESVAFKLGIASGIVVIMLEKGQFTSLVIGVSFLSFVCVWNLQMIGNFS